MPDQSEITQIRAWAAEVDRQAAATDDTESQDYYLHLGEAYRNVLHLIDPDHECEDCDA